MKRFMLLVTLCSFLHSQAWGIPRLLNFQGKVSEGGTPVTGPRDMTFRIYDASTGGQALFAETRAGAQAVAVSTGIFHVLIGEATPDGIPAGVFDGKNKFIEVQVGAVVLPRQRLTSVGYAFFADQARSLVGGATAQFQTIQAASVSVTGSLAAGQVGIGTANPTERLEVAGIIQATRFQGADGLTHSPRLVLKHGPTRGANLTTIDQGLLLDPGLPGLGQTGDVMLSVESNQGVGIGTFGAGAAKLKVLAGGAHPHAAVFDGGNVGIGTANPAARLDVAGDAQFGAGATKSTFSATGALTFPAAYAPAAPQEAATKAYVDSRLTSISTTSITTNIISVSSVVVTNVRAENARVTGQLAVGKGTIFFGATQQDTADAITFTSLAAVPEIRTAQMGSQDIGSATGATDLRIYAGATGKLNLNPTGSSGHILLAGGGGNVGIGVTADPTAKLEVAGTLKVPTGAPGNPSLIVGSSPVGIFSSVPGAIDFNVTNRSGFHAGNFEFARISGSQGPFTVGSGGGLLFFGGFGGATPGQIQNVGIGWLGDNTLGFTSNGQVAGRIDPSGNWAIGSQSPATKLDVAGDAQFGSGSSKSKFTITGALNIAADQDVTLSGAGKVMIAGSEVATKQYVDDKVAAGAGVANFSVDSDKIATAGVKGEKIAVGAVDTARLATDAVTTSKILDEAVTGAKIKDVPATKLTGAISVTPTGDVTANSARITGQLVVGKGTYYQGSLVNPALTNTITITQDAGAPDPVIRTASANAQDNSTPTGAIPLTINAGQTGLLRLNPNSSGPVLLANGGGKVGIGIGATNPRNALSVHGITEVIKEGGFHGVHTLQLVPRDAAGGTHLINVGHYSAGSEDMNLAFSFSGVEKMLITRGGRVGIGTLAPGDKLEVNGTSGIFQATPDNPVFNGGAALASLGSKTDSGAQLRFRNTLSNIDIGQNSFQDFVVEFSDSPALVVKKEGRVGIGTIDPQSKLSVFGGIEAVGPNNSSALQFNPGFGVHQINSQDPTGPDSAITFAFSSSEKMRITNDGRVGIGIANPPNKLSIQGGTAEVITDDKAHALQFQPETALPQEVHKINAHHSQGLAPLALAFTFSGVHPITGVGSNVESMRLTRDGDLTITHNLTVRGSDVSLPSDSVQPAEVSFKYAGSSSKGGAASLVAANTVGAAQLNAAECLKGQVFQKTDTGWTCAIPANLGSAGAKVLIFSEAKVQNTIDDPIAPKVGPNINPKDAACQAMGAYEAATALDAALYGGGAPIAEPRPFNTFGTTTHSLSYGQTLNGPGLNISAPVSLAQVACIKIGAPIRFTRGVVPVSADKASKDNQCQMEFGNHRAAMLLDVATSFIGVWFNHGVFKVADDTSDWFFTADGATNHPVIRRDATVTTRQVACLQL